MNSAPDTIAGAVREHARRLDVVALFELTKPRLAAMVLITTAAGFYLAAPGTVEPFLFLTTLLGTGLSAAGSLALNEYLERELDARMERTRDRPLPSGRVEAADALLFGAALTILGLTLLMVAVNPLAASITALTVVSYLALYTPMKVRTPLCSLVGAFPGALPPVTGWVAASGAIEPGAWALFGILFLWQLPHSLAIARLYQEDYARAGFKLLPTVDRDGSSTERQILVHSAALLVVGMVPTLVGVTGAWSFATALGLGVGLLVFSGLVAWRPSKTATRRMLFATLVYLPLLLAVMVLDKVQV